MRGGGRGDRWLREASCYRGGGEEGGGFITLDSGAVNSAVGLSVHPAPLPLACLAESIERAFPINAGVNKHLYNATMGRKLGSIHSPFIIRRRGDNVLL